MCFDKVVTGISKTVSELGSVVCTVFLCDHMASQLVTTQRLEWFFVGHRQVFQFHLG